MSHCLIAAFDFPLFGSTLKIIIPWEIDFKKTCDELLKGSSSGNRLLPRAFVSNLYSWCKFIKKSFFMNRLWISKKIAYLISSNVVYTVIHNILFKNLTIHQQVIIFLGLDWDSVTLAKRIAENSTDFFRYRYSKLLLPWYLQSIF